MKNIRIADDLYKRLEALADKMDCTEEMLLDDILEEALEEYEKMHKED